MSDAVSAATIVGAVLEQSGFLTQSALLDAFDGFFLSIGRFIYLLAIIGAVTSFAIFGSFRAVRYLIIGPVLFWFLVIPRTTIDGVMWRVSEKEKKINQTESKEIIDTVSQQEKPAEIATAFYLYIKFIDNVVRESVRVILAQNEKQDLFFGDRATVIESLVKARMSDPDLINMYENLLWGVNASAPGVAGPCADFMYYALGGSMGVENTESLNQLKQNIQLQTIAASVQGDIQSRIANIEKSRASFKELYDRTEEISYTKPNQVMRDFLTENQANPTLAPIYQKAVVQNENVSCREVWNTVAVGARMEAERLWKNISKEYRQKWNGSNADNVEQLEQDFCADVAEKMGGKRPEGECDLVPLLFLYVMRNSTSPDYLSRIAQRTKERMHAISPARQGGYQAVGVEDSSLWSADQGPFGELSIGYKHKDEVVDQQAYSALNSEEQKKYAQVMRFKKSGEDKYEWHTFIERRQVEGQFENVFRNYLRFDMERIRNSTFSFAMELPYWQGTILYLLAYIYPLWALIVIVPGRSVNFFLLPLLWLWAKSWDVGFALAMVFEQVLWNLMPHQPLLGPGRKDDILATKLPQDINNLMEFYAEGFRLDPTYNLHTYYWALSVVVLSIPSITGAAILKGRKSVLASFEQGASKMSNLVGQRARSAFGVQQINTQLMDARVTAGRAGLDAIGGADAGLLGLLKTPATGAAAAVAFGSSAAKANGNLGSTAMQAGAVSALNNAMSPEAGAGAQGGNAGTSESSGAGEMSSNAASGSSGGGAGGSSANGAASQSPPSNANGLSGGAAPGSDPSNFKTFAFVAGGAGVLGGQLFRVGKGGNTLEVDEAMLKTFQGIFKPETMHLIKVASVHGEDGRLGINYQMLDAMNAAIEGKEGFEINDYTVNAINEQVAVMKAYLEVATDVYGSSVEGLADMAERLGGTFGGDQMVRVAGTMMGATMIYQGFTDRSADEMLFRTDLIGENVTPIEGTAEEGDYIRGEYVRRMEDTYWRHRPAEPYATVLDQVVFPETEDVGQFIPFNDYASSTGKNLEQTDPAAIQKDREVMGAAVMQFVQGESETPIDFAKMHEWVATHKGIGGE